MVEWFDDAVDLDEEAETLGEGGAATLLIESVQAVELLAQVGEAVGVVVAGGGDGELLLLRFEIHPRLLMRMLNQLPRHIHTPPQLLHSLHNPLIHQRLL